MTQDIYPPPRAPGLMDVVYFTASGTFDKADYPGAQSVMVTAVGGGGGGSTRDNTSQAGAGGVGGGAVRGLIDIGALSSSETVTVGSGGSGAPSGQGATSGSAGGDSTFGSLITAEGGRATATFLSGSPVRGSFTSAVKGVVHPGESGVAGSASSNVYGGGNGGSSLLGCGGRGGSGTSGQTAAETGESPGGGGGGGSGTGPGADGADGIVIVEVYSTYAGNTGDLLTRSYVEASTVVYVGSSTNLISSASHPRPDVPGPVYWMMANGVDPSNALTGDIIFNANA